MITLAKFFSGAYKIGSIIWGIILLFGTIWYVMFSGMSVDSQYSQDDLSSLF